MLVICVTIKMITTTSIKRANSIPIKIAKMTASVSEIFKCFLSHWDNGPITKLKKKAIANGVKTAPIAKPNLIKRLAANSLKT